ncbi:MAG: hypothetical protein HY867_19820 [Chloroflexi bacterium]|nr:hypothetical protein [Chloroflexota bacterium]
MFKRILSVIGLLVLATLLTGALTAAAPMPNVTFTLVSGLPPTMNVGDTVTVIVQVESDQEFNYAQMLPTFYFPGRGVVAIQGGDHAGSGASATLEITFKAKGSTAEFGGPAPVSVVAGVRFRGGYTTYQRFDFNVTVP